MIDKYILTKKGAIKQEPDLMKWANWLEKAGKQRIIKQERIGEYFVSTVFLSLDQRFGFATKGDKPILWETMIFNEKGTKKVPEGLREHEQVRYSSKKEAEEGHKQVADIVKLYVKTKRKNK